MYYYTCPDCHSNLDPGEVCDCKKEKQPPEKECCFSSQVLQGDGTTCINKTIISQNK